jgi:hypothetical protein
VKLTTHIHLVPRLKMSGTTPPLPYVFIAWFLINELIKSFMKLTGENLCLRFDAFPASEYNEVFSGHQPGKVRFSFVETYKTEPNLT